jgi:hypothetical protein
MNHSIKLYYDDLLRLTFCAPDAEAFPRAREVVVFAAFLGRLET